MNSTEENYINHEVRVRVLEENRLGFNEKFNSIYDRFNRLEDKIDSHFKWTLGTILMLIVAVLSFMIAVYFK